jgi:hypothetical protein
MCEVVPESEFHRLSASDAVDGVRILALAATWGVATAPFLWKGFFLPISSKNWKHWKRV